MTGANYGKLMPNIVPRASVQSGFMTDSNRKGWNVVSCLDEIFICLDHWFFGPCAPNKSIYCFLPKYSIVFISKPVLKVIIHNFTQQYSFKMLVNSCSEHPFFTEATAWMLILDLTSFHWHFSRQFPIVLIKRLWPSLCEDSSIFHQRPEAEQRLTFTIFYLSRLLCHVCI